MTLQETVAENPYLAFSRSDVVDTINFVIIWMRNGRALGVWIMQAYLPQLTV